MASNDDIFDRILSRKARVDGYIADRSPTGKASAVYVTNYKGNEKLFLTKEEAIKEAKRKWRTNR